MLFMQYIAILTSSPEATGNVVEAVGCFGYESRLVDCSILMDTDCELRQSTINDCELPSGIIIVVMYKSL